MFKASALCGQAREFRFILVRMLKTDRESDRALQVLGGGKSGDQSAVDPAGEEDTNWNVASQAEPNGVAQQDFDLVEKLGSQTRVALWGKRGECPIRLRDQLARAADWAGQKVARRQFLVAREGASLTGHVA